MMNTILLAVDDSPASAKAIDYLASWLKGTAASVRVVHVLPHATTVAAKTGSDRPSRSERWLAMSREEAQPILMKAVERLKRDGMDPGAVEEGFLYLHPDVTAAQGLIDVAHEHSCTTLVVGRNALPWHRELFHHHIADELVKKAAGCTIWVVE